MKTKWCPIHIHSSPCVDDGWAAAVPSPPVVGGCWLVHSADEGSHDCDADDGSGRSCDVSGDDSWSPSKDGSPPSTAAAAGDSPSLESWSPVLPPVSACSDLACSEGEGRVQCDVRTCSAPPPIKGTCSVIIAIQCSVKGLPSKHNASYSSPLWPYMADKRLRKWFLFTLNWDMNISKRCKHHYDHTWQASYKREYTNK